MFRSLGVDDCHFKVAGGKVEIEKYADEILSQDADIVVVRDCDYTDIFDHQHKHRRILYTYGYSFENSLICPQSVSAVIQDFLKTEDDYVGDFNSWTSEFVSGMMSLVVIDVANEMSHRGLSVLAKSCERFCEDRKKHVVSLSKVEALQSSFLKSFAESEIADAERKVNAVKKSLVFVLRGHLAFSAVVHYVRHRVKQGGESISLSNEGLQIMLLPRYVQECQHREDFIFLKAQIDHLVESA
jgi:Protein of unknown function (DUF4435)